MAAQGKTVYLRHPVILAFLCQNSLASPVPEISPPETDILSFAELVQKAFSRILALGFFRGIAVSILILACLTCLLIGTLRGLAAYLNHHDTKLWESFEEIDTFDDDDELDQMDESTCRRSSISDGHRPCDFRTQQARSRNARYILANSSTPVTKVNVHASPTRATDILSPSPTKLKFLTPTRSPSTPLRSALTKSPPSSKRFSRVQSIVFGSSSRNSSTASSPSLKSVRWKDQLHISVTSTVELSMRKRREGLQTNAEAEMDVTTWEIGSRNMRHSGDFDIASPPAYDA